jgi:hypothetical protein
VNEDDIPPKLELSAVVPEAAMFMFCATEPDNLERLTPKVEFKPTFVVANPIAPAILPILISDPVAGITLTKAISYLNYIFINTHHIFLSIWWDYILLILF